MYKIHSRGGEPKSIGRVFVSLAGADDQARRRHHAIIRQKMDAIDVAWLIDALPDVLGSAPAADDAVAAALALTAASGHFSRLTFFRHLGWEVAHTLQALWAFDLISLEEATLRANALSEHLMSFYD